MGQDTTVIAERRFFRQESAPQQAPDGATWVTESDGAGNDTASRYTYDAETDVWELNSAVGPSEPNAGTNVPGATWRDTVNATPKQYDGTVFVSISVSLENIAVFSDDGKLLKVYSIEGGTANGLGDVESFDMPVRSDFESAQTDDKRLLPDNTADYTAAIKNTGGIDVEVEAVVNNDQVYNGTLPSGSRMTWKEGDYTEPHSVEIRTLDGNALGFNAYIETDSIDKQPNNYFRQKTI